jgi:hypothetical protein
MDSAKCGMTGSKAHLKGYRLKKQSQFAVGRKWRKVLYERLLCRIPYFEVAKKQSQLPSFGWKYRA